MSEISGNPADEKLVAKHVRESKEVKTKQNIRIPAPQTNRRPPLSPALCNFWAEKGGILKLET